MAGGVYALHSLPSIVMALQQYNLRLRGQNLLGSSSERQKDQRERKTKAFMILVFEGSFWILHCLKGVSYYIYQVHRICHAQPWQAICPYGTVCFILAFVTMLAARKQSVRATLHIALAKPRCFYTSLNFLVLFPLFSRSASIFLTGNDTYSVKTC